MWLQKVINLLECIHLTKLIYQIMKRYGIVVVVIVVIVVIVVVIIVVVIIVIIII